MKKPSSNRRNRVLPTAKIDKETEDFIRGRKRAWEPFAEEPVLRFCVCAYELHHKIWPNKKFEDIPDFFRLKAHVELYFTMLARSACDSSEAAKRLHFLATFAVKTLNELARHHPEHLKPIAGSEFQWPGFLSNHPEIEQKQKDSLFPELHLGQESSIRTQGKKFSFDTLETGIAARLWHTIDLARRSATDLGIARLRFPDTLLNDTIKLAPLTRKNHLQWWKVGERLFLLCYGKNYEERQEFSGYWKNTKYKDQKARPLIRRDIKNKIKQAFRSIAPTC